MIKTGVFSFILCFNSIRCRITPFIVGQEYSRIIDFPHSASINAYNCYNSSDNVHLTSWLCGASILTDRMMITAAHCLQWCSGPTTSIEVLYGNDNRDECLRVGAQAYIIHEDYSEKIMHADVAVLMILTPLTFGVNVRRAAILEQKSVPYHEVAYVAGWGNTDAAAEITGIVAGYPWLKHVNQIILTRSECLQIIENLPPGVICGKSTKTNSYPSVGDSGSALIVRAFIQVGMVSFKLPGISKSTIVYTDVGYYYHWITENTIRLYCSI